MAFLKIDKNLTEDIQTKGIVYLMKVKFDDGLELIKIGITSRDTINERLSENAIAIFNKFRYIPRISFLKFSKCINFKQAEKELHKLYKDNQYIFDVQFQGYKEYFKIDDHEELKETYCKVLKEVDDGILEDK